MSIASIKVTFPVAINISSARQRQLNEAIAAICEEYEAAHPDRLMWPAGIGGLPPPGFFYDEPQGDWDMSVLWIDVAERERYPGERDAPRARRTDSSAWLIERNDLGAPHWMRLGPGHRYTTYVPDANQAFRFARKCDAEAFIRHWECNDPVLHATEHAWLDVPRRAVTAKREPGTEET